MAHQVPQQQQQQQQQQQLVMAPTSTFNSPTTLNNAPVVTSGAASSMQMLSTPGQASTIVTGPLQMPAPTATVMAQPVHLATANIASQPITYTVQQQPVVKMVPQAPAATTVQVAGGIPMTVAGPSATTTAVVNGQQVLTIPAAGQQPGWPQAQQPGAAGGAASPASSNANPQQSLAAMMNSPLGKALSMMGFSMDPNSLGPAAATAAMPGATNVAGSNTAGIPGMQTAAASTGMGMAGQMPGMFPGMMPGMNAMGGMNFPMGGMPGMANMGMGGMPGMMNPSESRYQKLLEAIS